MDMCIAINNIFMCTFLLLIMHAAKALPTKTMDTDNLNHITSRERSENIPDDVYLEDIINTFDTDNLKQLEDPSYMVVDDPEVAKRFLGRWRNRNWILRQRQEQALSKPVEKRFFGRWMNRNFILRKLQEERENQSRLASERKNRLGKRLFLK